MFIAMNRFKIASGREDEFITIWKHRESHLGHVPGFKAFHLLQGQITAEYTEFASHSTWESADAFQAWTKSDAFRKAHASAGSTKGIYIEASQFEGYRQVL